MIQLFIGTDFPFMKYRRWAYLVSGILTVATIVWLVANGGPRLSVDFTGGTLIQIQAVPTPPADQIRTALERSGLNGVEIQQMTGENRDEFIVRMRLDNPAQDPFTIIQQAITSAIPNTQVTMLRTEQVGPKVGRELSQKAVWAILGSLAGILIYVGVRYEFKFAFGAVAALFHDVFVTLGILCFTNREITLTVIAALLTIAGYSINDTIVVFDRIRERAKALKKETHTRAMDLALNETLSRTLITSVTVMLTCLALYLWGGEVLNSFAFTMLVGVAFGTFSSIYVASAIALDIWIWLDRRKGIAVE